MEIIKENGKIWGIKKDLAYHKNLSRRGRKKGNPKTKENKKRGRLISSSFIFC